MTFVSYAQNFEDVMLWRALKHVKSGFYVDVGAQDPVVDSVSLIFYEHGWRGVHIEPAPYYAEKLRQHRPDEVVIQAAISATPGPISFFEIPDTGLSTGDRTIADRHRIQGFTVREVTVSCLTLTQVLQPYIGRDIHWLKIDVEGFERQVIEGWDEKTVEPWVVVIESTTPMSEGAAHRDWEPLVLRRNYQFAYFDGLNRYYVSKDHRDLLASFDRPPNVFDDFSLSGTSGSFTRLLNEQLATRDAEINRLNGRIAWQQGEWDAAKARLAQGEQQLAARDIEIDRLNGHIAWQQGEWDAAKARLTQGEQQLAARDIEIDRLNGHIAWQQGEWDAAKARLAQGEQQLAARDTEVAQIQQQLSAAQTRIAALLSSTSWRVTGPLRAIGYTARGIMSWPAPTKLRLKRALKPRIVRAADFLAARPALKSTLLLALRPFPRLHARLVRAARKSSVVTATNEGQGGTVPDLELIDLAPTARRVYQDLLDAQTGD